MFRKHIGSSLMAGVLSAALLLSPAGGMAASLQDEKDSYDKQAQEKQEKSNELQTRIDSISEEKRILDAETDAAVADYKAVKADLDAIVKRIEENESRLKKVQADYEKKSNALGKRVRDIYVNGQISYLDVLFGAKDFQDLMTRMDLLKRIIKQDYELVKIVLDERNEIEATRRTLEKDKTEQEPKVQKAKEAKELMQQKQKKRQALLDKMKNDKATIDRQYDELMAASRKIENMLNGRKSQMGSPSVAYTGGGGGGMVWPLSGPITSEFGWRIHPIYGTQKFHSGLDIGGDYGLPIVAAASGVVSDACWISGYGNTVIIDHGGGITTLYGHNQSFAVSVGQSVSQGEVIAYCGSTGNSTGPHCHFEVRVNGSVVSPYGYL